MYFFPYCDSRIAESDGGVVRMVKERLEDDVVKEREDASESDLAPVKKIRLCVEFVPAGRVHEPRN